VALVLGGVPTASPDDTALATVQNRLASIEDRKKAIDRLKDTEEPEVTPALLKLMQDEREPITLRAYISQLMIQKKDESAQGGLSNIVENSELPPDARKLALYILWKQKPQATASQLTNLVQNPSEPTDLRAAAMSYLSELEPGPPDEFWNGLAAEKQNPALVRMAALAAMEKRSVLAQDPTVLSTFIQDLREEIMVRKFALDTAQAVLDRSTFEQELLLILSQSKNPFEMRQYALDYLADELNPALVPQLRQMMSREQSPALRAQLKALLGSLSKSS